MSAPTHHPHHLCQSCKGAGRKDHHLPGAVICVDCEGSGEDRVSRQKKELQGLMRSNLEANVKKDIEAEIRGNLSLRAELEAKIRREMADEAAKRQAGAA